MTGIKIISTSDVFTTSCLAKLSRERSEEFLNKPSSIIPSVEGRAGMCIETYLLCLNNLQLNLLAKRLGSLQAASTDRAGS